MSVTEMHGNILQISNEPLTEDDHIDYEVMPEWFTNSIADYGGEERDTDGDPIGYILSLYPFKAQGDGFVLDKERVTDYFNYRYREYLDALRELGNIDLNGFIRGEAHLTVYELSSAENDRFGTYVCDEDWDLFTFDVWLRDQLMNCPDRVFYIGAILDYHC